MKNENNKNDSEFFLNIISEAPGHFYWKDTEGVCRGANNAQAIFLGYKSGKDLIGKTDFDFFSKEQAEFLWEIDRQVMETGKEYSVEETVNNSKGEKTIFFSRKVPLYDPGTKKVIGVLGTSLDITEQKQAHIAKQAFLQNMAHDIRTPLAGIIGLAQLQEMGHLKTLEEAQKYGRMIHGAGNQLLELLVAVINTVDTKHMTDPVKADPLDLSVLAKEMQALMVPSTLSKELQFQLKLDENLPIVLSDRIKLKRILINLLSNAVKFTKKGEIGLAIKLLAIKDSQADVEIKVSDTGIGIAKDKLNKIFDRLYRVHPTYEAEYSGYGLGLHLVEEGVKELNGQITVSSEEGKGSCFTLSFKFLLADKHSDKIGTVLPSPKYSDKTEIVLPSPKHSDKTETMLPSSTEVQLKTVYRSSVLIAEDDYIACMVLNNLLGEAGYEVTATRDGKAALEALKNGTFAWALLDIGLPGLKGTAVCEQYRQWEKENNKPRLPMFVLTGHGVDAVEKECKEAGIDRAFTKPFSGEILQDIEAFVNKK